MNTGKLNNLCQKAFDIANSGNYPTGSNYWMDDFSYNLNELIRKEYSIIPKDIKDLSALLTFADVNDPD